MPEETELKPPEEPTFRLRISLNKLTSRVDQLEQDMEAVNRLTDKVNLINDKLDELIREKVNPEPKEEPEVNLEEAIEPEVMESEKVNIAKQQGELTEKQEKALELIRKGLTNAEISKELGISRIMAFKYRKRLTELRLI